MRSLTVDLGGASAEVIADGTFALDGGAMFGIVPRPLWERTCQPDSLNRVRLGLNCLLVRAGQQVVIVDTGIGDKGDKRFTSRFDVHRNGGLTTALSRRGIEPTDVTDVINTHLHWDHAGGNTTATRQGEIKPVFPNATYHVQQGEVGFARAATARTQGSYQPEDYEPLMENGRVVLLDGEREIAPGVRVHPAAGHLPHMQVVTVSGKNGTVFFPSDLIPTTHHLAPAWIMAYDVEPLVTQEVKAAWVEQVVRGRWIVVFYHDPVCQAGLLQEEDGRQVVRPYRES